MVLRFWEPESYAVVLGASCRLEDDVDLGACRADGVPILRRSSGGGTVVVGPGELNVTLIVPQAAAPGLAAVDLAQRYVLERIALALKCTGAAVTIEGRGDLVTGGRKCAGSAQRRLKNWFMVHCSILYAFALERIVRYLRMPSRQPAYRAGRSHGDFLRNLELPREILVDAIGSAWSAGSHRRPRAALPLATAGALVSERFGSKAWIERF